MTEYTNKTREELTAIHKELKAKIMKLGFDLGSSKLKDVSQIKKTKRAIARVLTALNSIK